MGKILEDNWLWFLQTKAKEAKMVCGISKGQRVVVMVEGLTGPSPFNGVHGTVQSIGNRWIGVRLDGIPVETLTPFLHEELRNSEDVL